MKYVYFELNFLIFFKSLFSNKEIYFFLNDNKNNLKKKILNKKKKCKFINFETSKINLKNQNIHFVVDKLTNDYTMEIVNDLFNNNIVSECNKRFYNGDLKLAISRYIYLELNPLILKLETINHFLKGKKVINYNLSDEKLKWFIEKRYGILSNTKKNTLKTIKLKVSQILFTILNKCLSSFSKKNIDKTDKILIIVENPLNFEKYLRSDFFYLKKNSNKIIISKNKSFDQNTLKSNNVELINNFKFIFLRQEKKINLDINKRFDLLFEDKELINNFFGLINYLKNIKYIMKKISPIFLNNKIKCSISTSSDLISLSTEMLRGIFEFKTLTYQYSFLKKLNPIMSNCSNMMFIFSMYFFHIFNNFYSKPLETKITGYIYSSLINLCQDKEKFLKKKFGIKSNQIVISYFDENCDQSNWSLSTINEMEKKYIKICKFILKNKKFVILIKTQFLKNKPSVLFPNNEIIISAIKSKRFIEIDQRYFQKNYNFLNNGNIRNTVLPMMVAQISNITISEKYGGTTSLESIVLNKKNLLVNDKNFKWKLDEQLKKNIQFKNIDSILKKLKTYNPKKKKQDKLGDWDKIIKNNKILSYKIKKDKFITEFNKYIKK